MKDKVHDLSHLKANYKNKYGDEYCILKVDDSIRPYLGWRYTSSGEVNCDIEWFNESDMEKFTPITPPNPLLDKIGELKEDGRCARNLICITTDELDELEALAKEATHDK